MSTKTIINKNAAKKPGFWTHFAISLTIVAGVLAGNLKAEERQFDVEVRGKGPAVILIPGLMSDQRVWQQSAEVLSQDHQLHLINVKGLGQTASSAHQGHLLQTLTEQLADYIRQHTLHQPVVIGHSMGSFLALNLASQYPELTGKVVAVDGLPFLAPIFTQSNQTTAAQMQPQAAQLQALYQAMSAEQLKAMTKQGIHIQAVTPAAQRLVLQMAASSDPKRTGQLVAELLTSDIRSKMPAIDDKVLFLGANAGLPTREQQAQAAKLYREQLAGIQQLELEFAPRARHFIMLDQPSWFLSKVQAFLKD
ncbi:alpha/beta fold hydrolase [Rheinheimera marina]|uniref:Alpha/beta fold hydrolase n=1 Tax=Rheinheimera marina TaxID=1774958 RepID=A0ABV9JNY0_9GAMM